MKITQLNLYAPIEIGNNQTQVKCHREMEATEEHMGEISIGNGPITLRLDCSQKELVSLAWEIMRAGMGFCETKKDAIETTRKLILEEFGV